MNKVLEPQSRDKTGDRHNVFSLGETCLYLLAWALCFGIWQLNEPYFVIALLGVMLPGALTCGLFGLFLGGRRKFIPFALLGAAFALVLAFAYIVYIVFVVKPLR